MSDTGRRGAAYTIDNILGHTDRQPGEIILTCYHKNNIIHFHKIIDLNVPKFLFQYLWQGFLLLIY